MKTWQDFGIDVRGKEAGEVKTTCPRCSATRKKSTYPCLNANLDKMAWHCWHCDWSGTLLRGDDLPPTRSIPPKVYRKPVLPTALLSENTIAWFARRGIPVEVLTRNHITCGTVYMPQVEEEVQAIHFPYFRQGELVNCKYRDAKKNFRMASGAERILYGLDDIHGDTVVIVEGEIDKLSAEVAGYLSCVSVPDGAPAVGTKNYESKFDFLLSAEALLKPLAKIIIATDTDEPGEVLAMELARRLGPERCYRATWAGDCKDANEVLISEGMATLKECLDYAAPWPVSGIVEIASLRDKLRHIKRYGMARGLSTGWPTLNPHYTVRQSEMTLVTGIPSHGKSTWVSAMVVNLAATHQWPVSIFSPENYPLERYAATLLEQYAGKAFDGSSDAMTTQEMEGCADWLDRYVSFLMPEDDAPTIDHLLDLARIQVYRRGIKGLVLDPWNEIEHSRPSGQSETEYISQSLTKIRRFARHHECHVWLVVHPTKLRKDDHGDYTGQYPPPTPYDISGSAHWRNKADNCLCIWRDVDANDNEVQVHIQKIRFREIGKPGLAHLTYEPSCGRFHESTSEG